MNYNLASSVTKEEWGVDEEKQQRLQQIKELISKELCLSLHLLNKIKKKIREPWKQNNIYGSFDASQVGRWGMEAFHF